MVVSSMNQFWMLGLENYLVENSDLLSIDSSDSGSYIDASKKLRHLERGLFSGLKGVSKAGTGADYRYYILGM